MTNDCQHLLYASDSNYFDGLVVAISSTLLFADGPERLVVNIFDGGIGEKRLDDLFTFLAYRWPSTKVVRHQLDIDEFAGLKRFYGGSLLPYARLLAPRILTCKQVVYLDVDTLCLGDIEEFANIGFGGYALAAIQEGLLDKDCPFEPPADASQIPYCNSGVMNINLEFWRKEKVGENILELLRRNPDRFQFVDQTALNWYFRGRYQQIPQTWNVAPDEISRIGVESPKLIHFKSKLKPWQAHPLFADYRVWHTFWRLIIEKHVTRSLQKERTFKSLGRIKLDTLKKSKILRSIYCATLKHDSSEFGFISNLESNNSGYCPTILGEARKKVIERSLRFPATPPKSNNAT